MSENHENSSSDPHELSPELKEMALRLAELYDNAYQSIIWGTYSAKYNTALRSHQNTGLKNGSSVQSHLERLLAAWYNSSQ